MDRSGGRGRRGRCVIVALGFLLSFGSAHAQRRAADPEQVAKEKAAREHYTQGMLHYDLGEIDQAIADFKQAYALSAAPGLLFNIAQAYRYKKDYEGALHFYRTYLRLQPKASNRAEVEERVDELEKLIADGEKAMSGRPHGIIPPGEKAPNEHAPPTGATAPNAPPEPGPEEPKPAAPAITAAPIVAAPEPPPPADRSLRTFIRMPAGQAAIAVGAIGAGALIGAAILGGTVLSTRSDYVNGCDAGHCDDALYDSAHTRAVVTDVFIAVGAAAVVTSVILLAVRPGMRKQMANAPVRMMAHNLGVSF